jgi:alpha-glucosidase
LICNIIGKILHEYFIIINLTSIRYLWNIHFNLFFQKHIYIRNWPKSIKIAGQLRELLDQYPQRAAIGEVYSLPPGDPATSARYLAGGEKGVHLAFDFSLIFSSWNARSFYRCISEWYSHITGQGWPCNVLSNHDLFRHIERYPWRRHQNEKAKVAAFLLMTLRGTPFIYYGDEIGMKNGKLKKEQIRDPLGKKFWPLFSGRDKARTPMQWSPGPNAGFTSGKPWLPLNPDFPGTNIEIQYKHPDSLLNLYRSLIRIRKQHAALYKGRWFPLLNGRNGVLAYIRETEEEALLVILNFTRIKKQIRLQEHVNGKVIISTHRAEEEVFYMQELKLYPFEASLFNANGRLFKEKKDHSPE